MEQLNRSELRVKIMTILNQISIYEKNKIDYKLDDIFKEVLEIDNEFVKETVYGVITYKDEIDKIANKNMNDWTIDRLGYTDQAILRMGIFELLYTQTPDIVAINEAVELAKQYSDEKIKNMINGVMDNILHNK